MKVTCEVRCNKHIGWFNSPIFFGTQQLFEMVVTQGNRVECPFGGEMINCDKSNMRFRIWDKNGEIQEFYYERDDDGKIILKTRRYRDEDETLE